jgi:hypothetical protein
MGWEIPIDEIVPLFSTLQRGEFACRCTAGFGQSAKRAVTAFGAFNYPAGDMPPRFVSLASERENFASALKSDFHIGQSSRVKAFHNGHGRVPLKTGLSACRSYHCASRLRGPAPFGEKQSLQVGCVSEDARPLHGLGSLHAGLHIARFFQRDHRFGIKVDFGRWDFLFVSHATTPTCSSIQL